MDTGSRLDSDTDYRLPALFVWAFSQSNNSCSKKRQNLRLPSPSGWAGMYPFRAQRVTVLSSRLRKAAASLGSSGREERDRSRLSSQVVAHLNDGAARSIIIVVAAVAVRCLPAHRLESPARYRQARIAESSSQRVLPEPHSMRVIRTAISLHELPRKHTFRFTLPNVKEIIHR